MNYKILRFLRSVSVVKGKWGYKYLSSLIVTDPTDTFYFMVKLGQQLECFKSEYTLENHAKVT